MSRQVPEWIGLYDDQPIPPRVKARVFERHEGKCHRSGRKIRSGDAWQIDHVIALCNGGEHREKNFAPILADSHKEKTRDDLATKSKTERMRKKHLGIYPASRAKIQGRGFAKSRDEK